MLFIFFKYVFFNQMFVKPQIAHNQVWKHKPKHDSCIKTGLIVTGQCTGLRSLA